MEIYSNQGDLIVLALYLLTRKIKWNSKFHGCEGVEERTESNPGGNGFLPVEDEWFHLQKIYAASGQMRCIEGSPILPATFFFFFRSPSLGDFFALHTLGRRVIPDNTLFRTIVCPGRNDDPKERSFYRQPGLLPAILLETWFCWRANPVCRSQGP